MAEPSGGQPSRQQLIQVAEQLQSQLQELQQQQNQINDLISEIQQAKEAVDVVEDAEADEKVLLPLGSGAYVHARLEDAETVLAPIGGGVLAEESPQKAIERLESREKEARESQQEVENNMEQLRTKLQNLVSSIQGQGQPRQPGGGSQQSPEGPGNAG